MTQSCSIRDELRTCSSKIVQGARVHTLGCRNMYRRRGPMSTQTKPEVAAAVQLWTSFLEGLQRLQDDLEADKPAAARASIAGVFDTLRKVDDLPAKLPDITWSDLILRQKIPLRLGKVCSQTIQQQHHMSATTAALAAICVLMHKAKLLGTSGPEQADGSSNFRRIHLCLRMHIQQQLQQSGLLQVLPEAFAAAAAMLQADGFGAAAAAAEQDGPAEESSETSHSSSSRCSTVVVSDQSGSINNSSSTNSYVSSNSKDGSMADGPAASCSAESIQQHAELLLCLFAAVPRLWRRVTADPETSTHLAHIAVAGVQLVQTVMQAVSRQVQQAERSGQSQWQDSDEGLLMFSLLLQAHTAMRSLLDSLYSIENAVTHGVTSQCDHGPGSTAQHGTAAASAATATGSPDCVTLDSQPQLEQLLSSPHYIQCLSLMAAVLSYSNWPPIKKLWLCNRGVSSTPLQTSWYAAPSCYALRSQPEDLQEQQGGAASGSVLRGDLSSPAAAAGMAHAVPGTAAITAWGRGSILRDTLTEHQQELFARLGAASMTVCWAAASAADVPTTQHDSVNTPVECQLSVADVLTYWKARAHQAEQQQQQSTAGSGATISDVLQVWPELELLTAISLLPPLFVAASEQYQGFRRPVPPSHSQLLIDLGDILATLTTARSSSSTGGSGSSAAAGALPLTASTQSTLQQLRLAAIADLDSFVRSLTATQRQGQHEYDWNDPAVLAMRDLSGVCHHHEWGWDGPPLHWALAAGPSSPEQQQLCSLLASMLKFSYDYLRDGMTETESAPQSASVAQTACMLLSFNCCVAPSSSYTDSTDSTADSTACSVSSVEQPTAAAALSASSRAAARFAEARQLAVPWASSTPVAASAGLPCLVLLGRCCTVWAADIAAGIDWMLERRAQMQADPGSVRWDYVYHAAQVVCLGEADSEPETVGNFEMPHWQVALPRRRLPCYLHVMQEWLQSDGISSALTAAGYNPQVVIVQLNKVQAVTEAASSPTCLEAGPVHAAIHALRELGSLLCSFAVTAFCNNPSCSNVSGPTELSLVSGRCCMCGDCRIAHYCSRACQKQHWRMHKHVCKALKAAAACKEADAACKAAETARVAAGSAAITQPIPSAAELQKVVASHHLQDVTATQQQLIAAQQQLLEQKQEQLLQQQLTSAQVTAKQQQLIAVQEQLLEQKQQQLQQKQEQLLQQEEQIAELSRQVAAVTAAVAQQSTTAEQLADLQLRQGLRSVPARRARRR